MERAVTPEQITADCLYQHAVLRVYGPWPTCEALAEAERRRALSRVRHARLVLALQGMHPPPRPPAEVAFNETEIP